MIWTWVGWISVHGEGNAKLPRIELLLLSRRSQNQDRSYLLPDFRLLLSRKLLFNSFKFSGSAWNCNLILFFRSPSQGNLTKASWVAGGYWHQNSGWGSPTSYTSLSSPNDSQTTLTRSSSQSSGFGSSFQTGLFNRSPPDSRPESMLEEIDRLSVFSDNLAETRSFNEVASVRTRYQDNSPVPYTYVHNNLSQVSALSSVSSANADGSHFVSSPFSSATLSQWSWLLPFLFGFSLALNICLIYLVFSTSTKN